jgi:hypothetical protein
VRYCTRVTGDPDPDGRIRIAEILDVSFVDDGHFIGRDAAGHWHIPGGIVTTVPADPPPDPGGE